MVFRQRHFSSPHGGGWERACGDVGFSEAGPELPPVACGEFVPAANGGVEEVGRIAVEEVGAAAFVGVPPGLLHEGLFALAFVKKILLCCL